jgi:hypothetical protein
MQLEIIASSSYYRDVDDSEPANALIDLKELIRPLCRENYRRLDRYIQLALLGSGLCKRNLPPGKNLNQETALYIASGMSPVSSKWGVQEQIFRNHMPPKPAHFINTLSNSAGFYVARNLELRNKNIFVSRGKQSFEAGLQLLGLDLLDAVCDEALLGALEESPLPHWFLLRRPKELDIAKTGVEPVGFFDFPESWLDSAALAAWIEALPLQDTLVHCDRHTASDKAFSRLLTGMDGYDPPLAYYAVRTAGVICTFIAQQQHSSLLCINRDRLGRHHVLRFCRTLP